MNYNVLGEVCVCILSLVMLFNTCISFALNDKRNFSFFLCIIAVFLTSAANITSVYCISNYQKLNLTICTLTTTVYFFLLAVSLLFFTIYCYNFILINKPMSRTSKFVVYAPLVFYSIFLIFNIKTGWLFRYDIEKGYVRGFWKHLTYLQTLIYATIVIVTAVKNKKNITKRLFLLVFFYPILCVSIISIQFISTYWVVSGTSSFATLLLLYLGIQSEIIDFDFMSGMFTEKEFERIVATKKGNYCLTAVSIEGYAFIEEKIGYNQTEVFITSIANILRKYFGKSLYRSSTKIGIIAKDIQTVKQNVHSLLEELENLKIENNLHKVDFLIASLNIPENATTYNQAVETISELFARARSQKGQKFIYCDEKYVREIQHQKLIHEILQRELKPTSKQFQVYLQPIYSIKENKFMYAEALSRLKNTEIGEIYPSEFIPIAESHNLIEKLGNVVFEKICMFISENKDIVNKVSVNFSVYQMTNPKIVDFVLGTINKYGISTSNIIMEITESIFIDDFDLIRKHMMELSEKGITFYLDDFGTGFSNFANVIALPFSTIKIDRSFVLMMEQNKEMALLVNSLIHTFKDTGLNILVEGVENSVQNELIKKTGSDYIQGYFYSKPLSKEDCLKLFNEQKENPDE